MKYEDGTPLGFWKWVLAGGIVVLPLIVWVVDLFERFVDELMVRLERFSGMG
jgi:hypothetical protein